MSGLGHFVFLDLPLEIRDMVYGYLLIHENSEDSYAEMDFSAGGRFGRTFREPNFLWILRNKWRSRHRYDLHPAIMRTNSHVHAETSRILYGKNYFTWSTVQPNRRGERLIFENTPCLDQVLPNYYSRLITKLDLRFNCGDPRSTRIDELSFRWDNGDGVPWFNAMERTVKATATTLQFNKLKHLSVSMRLTTQLDMIAPRTTRLQHYANVLAPLAGLREVGKIFTSTPADRSFELNSHGPIIALKNGMIESRSDEEEATRIEGWNNMGIPLEGWSAVANPRGARPEYWYHTIKELKNHMAKRRISVRGLKLKAQFIYKLEEADADLEVIVKD